MRIFHVANHYCKRPRKTIVLYVLTVQIHDQKTVHIERFVMSAEELHENNNAPNRLKQIQDLMFREYIDDWENKVKVLYRKIKELEAQTSESSKNLDD